VGQAAWRSRQPEIQEHRGHKELPCRLALLTGLLETLMKQPLVINVILNTNRREDTLACLAAVTASDYSNQKTMVLDNASTDGSIEAISARFPQVQIVPLKENLGYAGNNNVGIELALKQGADWVFVLNEDITLASDCLSELIKVAESDPCIGIAGPLVYHFDEPGVIQSAGGNLDRFWRTIHAGQNAVDKNQFPAPRMVDWISGCAILVRREVIEQVGMLDARFFYYWEETEWCLRARRGGWQIWHAPQAKIWHKGVQINYSPSPNITYYAARNKLIAMEKHHAPASVWLYTVFQTIRTLVSWTIRPKWKHMKEHRKSLWKGTIDFLVRRYGKRT
jgi:GT2 family glycosyltransferase